MNAHRLLNNSVLTTSLIGLASLLQLLLVNPAFSQANFVVKGTVDATNHENISIVGDLSVPLTGLVSITNDNDIATGVGTFFTTELQAGDAVRIGNLIRKVQSVVDDTQIMLSVVATETVSSVTAHKDANLLSVNTGNGDTVFNVDKSGNVDIESDTNIDGNLFVDGRILVNTLLGGSATDLCIAGGVLSFCSSSERYKRNVNDLELGLETVQQLRPVEFDWKTSKGKDLGFVAEEVADVNSVLATYHNGEVEGVKYKQLTAVLVNAVQELSVQNQILSSQNEELFELNHALLALTCLDHPEADVCQNE